MTSTMGHDDQETAVGGPVDELWLQLHAGSATGWDELYRDHADELHRYFTAKLPDRHEVDDCVHEVFLRAVATATKPEAKPVASMGAWLQGIARNVLKTRYEDAGKRRELFDPQPVEDALVKAGTLIQGATDHADRFDNDGKRQALADAWEVIQTLPPSRRTLLITFLTVSGREGREVKGAELAAEMGEGWPRARVDRELSRARSDVRRGMGVLAVARKASGCVDAAALVGKVHPQLRFADLSDAVRTALAAHANSSTATMVGVDRARESTPKAGCKTCLMIFRDAQRSALYALGPGLLLLAAYTKPDDDERHRALSALVSDGSPDVPTSAASPGALTSLVQRGCEGGQRVLNAVTAQLTRLPGFTEVAQLAQSNPVLVRGIGAALVVGVVAAGATIAIPGQGDGTAAGPQPPTARSAEPGPAPFPGTSPTSGPTPGPALPGNPAIPGGPAAPGNPVIPSGPAAPGNPAIPGGSAATPATPTPTAVPGQPDGPGPTPTGDQDRPAPPDPPTVPASWGFAFVRWPDDPIGASHDLSAANPESNWTFGLWRLISPPPSGKPTVTHLAVGKHRVRLPGIGVPGGIVHVTATDFSAAGSFCQPSGWEQDGVDEVIDVACFDSTGRFADVPFGIVFTAGTADNPLSPGGVRGFVYNNRPTAATFTPDPIYRRNMGAVTRLGTGRYTVAVPDSGEAVQISPVGTAARHCTIADRRTATVEVACVAHGGSPADTAFTLSYAGRQNLLDDRRAATGNYLISTDAPSAVAPSVSRSWSSAGRPVTLARQSTSQYEIHFPAGLLPSSTHVTATGGGYCNMPLRNDYSQPDNVIIRIACFTATGERSNSGFHLIYMSARI